MGPRAQNTAPEGTAVGMSDTDQQSAEICLRIDFAASPPFVVFFSGEANFGRVGNVSH